MVAANKNRADLIMQQLKKMKTVALVLLLLLTFVLIRINNPTVFKEPVNSAIDGTRDLRNLITPDQLQKQSTSSLLIDLNDQPHHNSIQFQKTLAVPLERLLDRENRKILNEAKGNLVLFAKDIATSSKAWIILNQLGYRNLFILTSEADPEMQKYQFQPDTTARLEQDPL